MHALININRHYSKVRPEQILNGKSTANLVRFSSVGAHERKPRCTQRNYLCSL